MLEGLVEVGIEHHAAIEVQQAPTVTFHEVPAEEDVGAATVATVDSQTDLPITCLKDPRAGFVDHTNDTVTLSRCAPETRRKRQRLVESRLNDEISRPVDEADFAV